MSFRAACIQMNSQNDLNENIDRAISLSVEAVEKSADFIALPENFAFLAGSREEKFANAYDEKDHPALIKFQEFAKKYKKWILLGSISVKITEDKDKLSNRSILLNDKGEIVSRYDKIHLYDVDVKGGEKHKESNEVKAGNKRILAKTPWCDLGLTICYDLRFPYLYRELAQKGAKVIAIPSAFTEYTGAAHWHVLVRARAIETSSYIIAPAQTGSHPKDRKTFGHSLIVDPWGEILAEAGSTEEVIVAKIDLSKVDYVREMLPSLSYKR